MAKDSDIIDMTLSERGQRCVAALQEVIANFDLTATDGAMAVGELFAWAHILGFMPVGKERMLAQMDRSAASARQYAVENFEAFQARAEILAALDDGESGGRLQ